MDRKGTVYCVGVGPGDPELMTLKAVRIIKENKVIAVPGAVAAESVAYRIAVRAVPELAEKELVAVEMPMVKDREILAKSHRAGAALLERYLQSGENVVYLTLGDSTVYCTFTYLQPILEADGFSVEYVNGIPSFCAAAARLKVPLSEWDEPLHIVPAVHKAEDAVEKEGNYVLMKSASQMKKVKEVLKERGLRAQAVENCSMETEKAYHSLEEIPDDAGYFTLVIAKSKNGADENAAESKEHGDQKD